MITQKAITSIKEAGAGNTGRGHARAKKVLHPTLEASSTHASNKRKDCIKYRKCLVYELSEFLKTVDLVALRAWGDFIQWISSYVGDKMYLF